MLVIVIFIIVLVITAALFSKKATEKNRSPYLWAVIGVMSVFVMPIIFIKIIVLINREWLQEIFLILMGYIILSFICVCAAYYILEKLPNPKDMSQSDDNLLDSDLD